MAETDVKELLLLAAERLFAEFGIEAVSCRQIAIAAGQRNQSAISYHFGSRDDVIRALQRRRVSEINRRRAALLDAIERGPQPPELRALIGAIARPLAEKVAEGPEGSNFVRFLAHVFSDRHRRDMWLGEGEEAELLRRIYRAMRRLSPGLPEALWTERLRMVVGGIIHALADRERMRADCRSAPPALPGNVFIGNIIDAGAALLSAPISEETAAAMRTNATEGGGSHVGSGTRPDAAEGGARRRGRAVRADDRRRDPGTRLHPAG